MKLPLTNHIRLPLFIRVVALYVLVGLPAYGIFLIQPDTSVQASVTSRKPAVILRESDVRIGKPVSIAVPRLNIELSIVDGQYDKASNNWTLSEDKAQFAAMTALPNNETGNTFVYGHNTAAVFAPLAQLQTGDEAVLRTSNGLVFHYRFSGNQIVNPNATSILEPSDAPQLTLMTCEGIFSEARRVAIFDFEKVL